MTDRTRYPRDNRPHDRAEYERMRREQGADDRGFLERAGDEVRSWFDDDDHDRDDRSRRRGSFGGPGDPGTMSRSGYEGPSGDRSARERPAEEYEGGGGGRSRFGRATYGGSNPDQDPFATSGEAARRHDDEHSHYRSWRDEQVARLDRDYAEFRRERESEFHSEFDRWRGRRQEQRGAMRHARVGMEAVCRDDAHLGTVDRVTGDRIWLAGDDAQSGGHRHSIPVAWIDRVDDKVRIERSRDDAMAAWRDEAERESLFTGEMNEAEARYRAGLPAEPRTAQTLGRSGTDDGAEV